MATFNNLKESLKSKIGKKEDKVIGKPDIGHYNKPKQYHIQTGGLTRQ